MKLRGVDLNLVPILQTLLREVSVTRTAQVLGLSQPATSQALARLRVLLKDPLLVKVGRTMKLTPRAERLRLVADQACSAVETLLSLEQRFDPATAAGTFTIATPDYMALIVGRDLLPLLRESAPGLAVSFVDANLAVRDLLVNGDLDLALVGRMPLFDGLSMHEGFQEDLVCVSSIDHPLARRDRVSLDELSRYRQLSIDLSGFHLRSFGAIRAAEPMKIAPSHLLILPLLVAGSGSVAIVTRALAELAANYAPLKLIELREPGEPLEVCVVWNPAKDTDPGHQWLRDQIAAIMERQFRRVIPLGVRSRRPMKSLSGVASIRRPR